MFRQGSPWRNTFSIGPAVTQDTVVGNEPHGSGEFGDCLADRQLQADVVVGDRPVKIGQGVE